MSGAAPRARGRPSGSGELENASSAPASIVGDPAAGRYSSSANNGSALWLPAPGVRPVENAGRKLENAAVQPLRASISAIFPRTIALTIETVPSLTSQRTPVLEAAPAITVTLRSAAR